MSFKFEDCDVLGSQMNDPISDLLETVAEWYNSDVRVIIIIQAVSLLL